MKNIRVKICGITQKEDLEFAVNAGADAVGFVVGVPSSLRNISLRKASNLIKQVPPFVKSVLVTVPKSLEELEDILKILNPGAIQIHGANMDEKVRDKLPNRLLIRAVNANVKDAIIKAEEEAKIFDAIILDSFIEGKYGGTGITHDWRLSRKVKQAIHPKPLILAGGLTPENVADAVQAVEPYAVDVSSGVEWQPGIKDHQKILKFVENAKRC
jgi:phosphoribosylanthranilate isomerase